MKKILFLTILIFFAIAKNIIAQNDTATSLFSNTDTNSVIQDYSQNFSFDNLNNTFELQTEVQAQKLMKNIYLSGFVFMSLVVIFLLLLYHTKIKKIFETLEKQNDDLLKKNFQIEKLNLLLQKTFDAVAIIDKNANVLWGNLNFYKLRGLNLSQEVNIQHETPEIKQIIEKINSDPKEYEYKTRLPQKNIIISRKIFPLVKFKDEKIENFGIIEKIYENT